MKVALDTNVLAYAEGIDDVHRHDIAVFLVQRLSREQTVIPVQVLGELYNVLARRTGQDREYARQRVLRWRATFNSIDTNDAALNSAIDLAVNHRFSIWDAVVLAVSAKASCRLLLSEDMHHGFTWNGVTIVNPFLPERHPLLAEALT